MRRAGMLSPIRRRRAARGSAYVMVLMTAILATVVGLSGLYSARVQRRASELDADAAEARLYAISAVDRGLLIIDQNSDPADWRNLLSNNGGFPILNRDIGRGAYSLNATDPSDGDLASGDDPVTLTGIGAVGQTLYMLELQLDAGGNPIPGTWRRVVD